MRPAPLASPSGASSPAGVGVPPSPARAGDADLVVVLRAPAATPAAGRPGPTTLTCESLSGTTLAVLEVDDDSERVAGLQERLEERLSAMLARSGAWSQRVRLAFPDGSTLLEPSDMEQSVRQLLGGPRWREAEASREANGGPEVAQTPSAASRHSSRGTSRRSTGAQELERKLGKLQDAKHMPLSEAHSRRTPTGAADTVGRLRGSAPADAVSGSPAAAEVRPGGDAGAAADSKPPLGDRVVMASSQDEDHPPDNVIDGSDATYWISTGLYPQMILLELRQPTRISTVRLATTDVRGVHVEGCSGPAATSFETLGSAELDLAQGGCRLQMKELRCEALSQPTRFVKTTILSGWNDFCSVHRIVVE